MQPYWLSGTSRFEVVGTNYRKEAFKAALNDRSRFDREPVEVNVCLVPEPDNPYDRNAVSIRVDGVHHIGYLRREVAAEWTPILYNLIASSYFPVVKSLLRWTPAYSPSIEGGGFTDAYVYLPENPHLAIPLNDAPLNSALIPTGRSTQVTKEEDHFDVLFDYVTAAGEATIYLELRLGSRTLKNGEARTIVYVFLDDQHVGELSSTMGKTFEPTLRHLSDVNRKAVVLGTIKGSSLAAALTFRAARPEEISDDWLKDIPQPPRSAASAPSGFLPPPAYIPAPEPERPADRGETEDQLIVTTTHAAVPKRRNRKLQSAQPKGSGCMMFLIAWLGAITGAGAAITQFI